MIDPTDSPEPYTSAEFRTDRDALGLSVSTIAAALGVADVTVWQYQSVNRAKPIPERVHELMRSYARTARKIAVELADAPGELVRPADDDALALMHPELEGWGVHAYGLILHDARLLRFDRGVEAKVAWLVAPTPDAA